MQKAKFIGTVVAGNSQREAVASYLRTLNANYDNSKVVFGTSESSGVVFLTSVENLASPMSPTTGEQTCVALIEDQEVIASKLQLQTEGEMVASENFKLKSCTCPNCNSMLVSDNAELLANCIICGTEQDSEEEEGEDNVDVRIVPEGEEGEEGEEALASANVDKAEVVAALKKRGIQVTEATLAQWIEGSDADDFDEEAVAKFDEAVAEFLTKPVYDKFQRSGRLCDKLMYELGLLEGEDSGGVSLANDEELEVDIDDEEEVDDAEIEAALSAEDDEDLLEDEEDDESEEDESEDDEEEDTNVSDESEEDESEEDESTESDSSDDLDSEVESDTDEGEVESSEYCKPVVTQDMNRGTIGASDNESVSAIRRPRPGPSGGKAWPKTVELKVDWIYRVWTIRGNPWAPSTPTLEKKLAAYLEKKPESASSMRAPKGTVLKSTGDVYAMGDIEYTYRKIEMTFTQAELKKFAAEKLIKVSKEMRGPARGTSQSSANLQDETQAMASVNDIDFDSELEVDLVHDNIGSAASLASNNVKLVYAPSDNFAESRWYAIANGAPVAVASVQSVGDKASIFATDNFRKGTETLMSQIGVAEGLTTMGFQSLKIRMPVKAIVANRVAEATAAVKQESATQIASIREDLRAAIATAAVGINKGFFSALANPIKAELFDVLSSAGVQNAEVLIDNAFGSSADDYHKVLLAKAFDLLKKPVDARNEISQAVATASYQRSSAPESAASLSSSVSRQLSSIGSSRRAAAGVMTASAASPQSHTNAINNERMRSVIGGLGR